MDEELPPVELLKKMFLGSSRTLSWGGRSGKKNKRLGESEGGDRMGIYQ